MKKIFGKIKQNYVLYHNQIYYICKYLNSKYLKDETNIKTIALAIVLIAGYNVYTSQQDVKMFSLTLANIEALAMDETSQCDNANGYRRILGGDERIYDCCYLEKVGKGKEDCKRW